MAEAASKVLGSELSVPRLLLLQLSGARQEEADGVLVPAAPPLWVCLHCLRTVKFLGKRRRAQLSQMPPGLPTALQAAILTLLQCTWLRVCCVGSATVLLAVWASSFI